MTSGGNGHARRATLTVRLGSLRKSSRTVARASERAPARTADAATLRAAQNEPGWASTPSCAQRAARS